MENAKQKIRQSLLTVYPEHEIRSISRLLLSDVTGWNFTELITNKNSVFSENQMELIDNYLEKLKNHVPVQYVLGKTEFFGLPFLVTPDVLIPRPETEELVDWVLSEINNKAVSVLDFGTGSGCIPVSIKYNHSATQMHACDISENALKMAKKNADLNKVVVTLFQFDFLKDERLKQKYDVFVSNPPYIPQNEVLSMDAHVVEHEPHLALFVPDHNPLLFYEKIALLGKKYLLPGGRLYFEIHRSFGAGCIQMLQNQGYIDINLKKDMSGNDRMIRAVKPFTVSKV